MTHPRGGAASCQAYHTIPHPLGQPEARNQLFKESPIQNSCSSKDALTLYILLMYGPKSTWEDSSWAHLTKQLTRMKSLEQKANNKRECPRPGRVTVVMANNLTSGHCPTATSHHDGFWGRVPLLFSLAWKRDHIPLKSRQALSRS